MAVEQQGGSDVHTICRCTRQKWHAYSQGQLQTVSQPAAHPIASPSLTLSSSGFSLVSMNTFSRSKKSTSGSVTSPCTSSSRPAWEEMATQGGSG